MDKDTVLLIFYALANADVQLPWEQRSVKAWDEQEPSLLHHISTCSMLAVGIHRE